MLSTEAQVFRYFVGGRQSPFFAHRDGGQRKEVTGPLQKFIIYENLCFSTYRLAFFDDSYVDISS